MLRDMARLSKSVHVSGLHVRRKSPTRRTIRKSQISRKVAAVFRDPKTDLMIEDFLKKINET